METKYHPRVGLAIVRFAFFSGTIPSVSPGLRVSELESTRVLVEQPWFINAAAYIRCLNHSAFNQSNLSCGLLSWTEIDQVDVEALDYHCHSASSQLDWFIDSSSSSLSSFCAAIAWKASAQPCRGCYVERITISQSCTSSSTSSPGPVCCK